ncbi:MAG: cytochrome c maturation protein CcmE [Rhodobiaceae bacterium]|nr:cytochrome c maturation protein CcmE [Rhodobiaceae bacterium]
MFKRRKRATLLIILISITAVSIYLILWALRDNIVFFYSPTEIYEKVRSGEINDQSFLRLGGMVKESSVLRSTDGSIVFTITDFRSDIRVYYLGIVPDLFREGQGVIAEGRIKENFLFNASSILAKHDENYMPPEVKEILEKNNVE